jgi:hypothetical protein
MVSPGYRFMSSPAGVEADARGTAAHAAKQSKENNRTRLVIILRIDRCWSVRSKSFLGTKGNNKTPFNVSVSWR